MLTSPDLRSFHRVLFCLCLLQGCAEPAVECHTSLDCAPSQRCEGRRCLDPVDAPSPLPIEATEPGCEGARAPDRRDLILHELLAAVPADPRLGDTNGDGLRDPSQDEFIELVNVAGHPVLTRGLRLSKGGAASPFAQLQTPCLAPGRALVLLGGLREDAPLPAFGDARVEVAERPMRLSDGGGELLIQTVEGQTLFEGAWPAATGSSVTLWPERVSHDRFRPHVEVAAAHASPGTCADGQPFASGCPPQQPPCPNARLPRPGDLWLAEVLAAVPGGSDGDANGDGVTSATRDEFIELVNLADAPLRVEGLRLLKDDREVSALRAACLQPRQALVWFAGLEPGARPPAWPDALVEISPKTWSLRRDGGPLRLETPDGVALWDEVLPASTQGSLARAGGPDRPGAWAAHPALADGALMSPGRCLDGRALSSGCASPPDPCDEAPAPRVGELLLHELLARPAPGLDADGDGQISATGDEFIEVVSVADGLRRVEGVTLEVNREPRHRLRGCLEPLEGLVIYGGQGPLPLAGAVRADRSLRLGNEGARVSLQGADGELLALFAYDRAPEASLQLWPELDPEGEHVPHLAPGMSPGRCADGAPFESLCIR